MSTPVQDPARVARRRREHERQAVIYGILGAVLLLVGLGALAIYTGAIEAPFARDFTNPSQVDDDVTPPCLPPVEGQPDGPLPVPASEIHVRIYNASGTAGIAGANRTVLERRGFAIDGIGDHTTTLPRSELRFGVNGIVAAYTLAAHFPRMNLVLDTREDATVDLLVGERYDRPLDEDEVQISGDTPLRDAAGCRPADRIEAIPAPTPPSSEE